MAIAVAESVLSRRYNETAKGGHLERIFIVTGADDPSVVLAHDDIPKMRDTYGDFDNLYVSSRSVEVEKVTGVEEEGLCRVTVIYEPPERQTPPPPSGEDEFEFSTMARTEHRVTAFKQEHYPETEDVGDVIGVNDDKVEGVDIFAPKMVLREVHDKATLSYAYRNTLTFLTGRVNNADWKGFSAGEVLFLGASASRSGYGPWRIEYQFSIEKNETLLFQTLNGPQTIDKEGWRYIWFRRAKTASDGDTKIQYQIESVHVARVYSYGDFAELGIGT